MERECRATRRERRREHRSGDKAESDAEYFRSRADGKDEHLVGRQKGDGGDKERKQMKTSERVSGERGGCAARVACKRAPI